MKIQMLKQPGGVFSPASDIEAEKLSGFKTGELYTIEIKKSRNPAFHRKVFSFFNFCFEYWASDNDCQTNSKQFDVFRNHLTVLAGYYDQYVGIKGDVRIEAKSLSFSSMSQLEFQDCYTALVNAAMKHLFRPGDDESYVKLLRFFD